jgi:hypothetical protein
VGLDTGGSSTLDPYFEKMAAQGQNFFAASGDSSTWSSSNEAWPADDAHVVSVGGTDLVTASAAGPWKSETAWTDSGGGISPDSIAIPSWQQLSGVINSSNKGSTTLRNGPDVSANANFHFTSAPTRPPARRTSTAAPASRRPCGLATLPWSTSSWLPTAKATIGFINPTIYAQNVTSSYAGLPRHHQRHIRQLFGCDRLRSGHRLGQSERRADRRPFRTVDSRLQPFRLAHFGLGGTGQLGNIHHYQYGDGRL